MSVDACSGGDNDKTTTSTQSNEDNNEENDIKIGIMSDNNQNSDTNTSLPLHNDQVHESLSHNETNDGIIVELVHRSISNFEQTIDNNLQNSVIKNEGDNANTTTSTQSNEDNDEENDITIGIMSDNNINADTMTSLPVYKDQVHESLNHHETNNVIIVEPVHGSVSNYEQTIDNNLQNSARNNDGDNENTTTSTQSNHDNDEENVIATGIISDNDINSDTTTSLPMYKDQVHESESLNHHITNDGIIVEPLHASISNCDQTTYINLPNYKDQVNEFDSNEIDSHIESSLNDKHNSSENAVVVRHQSEIIESSNLITSHDDGRTILLEATPVHNFDPNLVFAQVIDGDDENHNNVDNEENMTIINNNNNETANIIDSSLCQDNNNNNKPNSIESITSHKTNESTNNGRGVKDSMTTASTALNDRKWEEKRKFLFLSMLILLVTVVVIVIVVVLVVNNNRGNNNDSINDSNTSSSNTNNIMSTTLSPTILLDQTLLPTSSPTISKKSIASGTELMSLVDQFVAWEFYNADNNTGVLIGTNQTSSDEDSDDIEKLLDEYGLIEFWYVSKVNNFSNMFSLNRNYQNHVFNHDLNDWNVSNAVDLSAMFETNDMFNGNLSNWDVSNVALLDYMFYGTFSFSGIGLDLWNISSKVTSLDNVFMGAMAFDCNLSNWNTSNVVSMNSAFDYAQSFRGIGIEKWDVSKVTNIVWTFGNTNKFNANLSLWNVSNVIMADFAFVNATSFEGIGLELWDLRNVKDIFGMFEGATNFQGNELSNWTLPKVTALGRVFARTNSFVGYSIEKWNVQKITNMRSLFDNAKAFNANLSNWDVSSVLNVQSMFNGAETFVGNGLSNWDVRNVVAMDYMFANTIQFHGENYTNITNWNTSNVQTLIGTFLNSNFNGNLSGWDVSNVLSFNSMFMNASNFIGYGLDQWNIQQDADTTNMFCGATSFDINYTSSWNITNYDDMFC